jgi:Putative antitoxin of bacterial toxin-antitoxin system, YdaS/YdaT
MDFNTWIAAGHHRGAWLAQKLGVTRQAVHNWRIRGVPRKWQAQISRLSGRAVTVSQMRTER